MPKFLYFLYPARVATARKPVQDSTAVFFKVTVENIKKATNPANEYRDVDQVYNAAYTYINNVVEKTIDATA
jgi:hypothetical protein